MNYLVIRMVSISIFLKMSYWHGLKEVRKRLLPKSTRRQKLLSLRNILILPFYNYMYYGKGKS